MFDGSGSRRFDHEVVDVPLPRARVRTEDFVMHVMVEGLWHRRLPDLTATSCGSQYHAQFAPVRREEMKHPLCTTCFTSVELGRADAAEIEEDDDAPDEDDE